MLATLTMLAALTAWSALFFGSLLGCGTTRQDTLGRALAATNAAAEGFATWDEHAQAGIVDAATSRQDGEAQLAAHRARRDRVFAAFAVAYKAIAAAALDGDAPLATVLVAATDLYAAIAEVAGPEAVPAPTAMPQARPAPSPSSAAPTPAASPAPAPAH